MAYRDGASSVQGILLRITPLTVSGSKDTTKPVHWTKGFISLSFSPEVTTGDEIETKAADGSVCVSWKADDSLKRININLSLCNVDPEALVLLTGGQALVDATDKAIGYSSAPVGRRSATRSRWRSGPTATSVASRVSRRTGTGRSPTSRSATTVSASSATPHWPTPSPARASATRHWPAAGMTTERQVACCTAHRRGAHLRRFASTRRRLVNPFSYVEAADQNIPAMLAPDGTTVCADCAGSYMAVVWKTSTRSSPATSPDRLIQDLCGGPEDSSGPRTGGRRAMSLDAALRHLTRQQDEPDAGWLTPDRIPPLSLRSTTTSREHRCRWSRSASSWRRQSAAAATCRCCRRSCRRMAG